MKKRTKNINVSWIGFYFRRIPHHNGCNFPNSHSVIIFWCIVCNMILIDDFELMRLMEIWIGSEQKRCQSEETDFLCENRLCVGVAQHYLFNLVSWLNYSLTCTYYSSRENIAWQRQFEVLKAEGIVWCFCNRLLSVDCSLLHYTIIFAPGLHFPYCLLKPWQTNQSR